MTEKHVKRKISAIFSADVEGYSRLMGEDEVATVRTLENYRKVMVDLIEQHRGRVVDSPGDNLLAEFGSVVDAVQCAVEIQQVLKAKNAELPENRRMQFRIGVNLGDVIEEGERIYGDGINIAARIEGLAEGGGICVSGSAYEQIENKLALGYEYLGEHAVKNITKPVRVYKVPMELGERKEKRVGMRRWKKGAVAAAAVIIVGAGAFAIWNFYFRPPPIEPASVEKMAFPLPDKPSIAVLPFVNMSEDPKQEYFSDGITEEIITALSKTPKMLVIARNSTFTYKGKPVKVNQVAEELGVQYVLEGSVRKVGDRVRITAQLIDALTGHHVWAERYDRDLKDIFALQDEITIKIITELQVKLTDGEQARLFAKGTENIQAYLKYLQAREYFQIQTKENNAMARRLLEEVIALDSRFPQAYNSLGATHWMDIFLKSTKSPKASLQRAFELTKKTLSIDDSSPQALSQLGWLYTLAKEHDKGIVECERAVALDPNSASAHIWISIALRYAGRHEEAVRHSEKALRLNPIPPSTYFRTLGAAYNFAGRYEDGITAFKKALNRSPNDLLSHVGLAQAYSLAGRMEEAHAEAEKVLKINPGFSLEYYMKQWSYKNQADKDLMIYSLRKAGLPDKPPLPLPDKPSIAVLPFVNMSGDPEQEYFSDGITEEIITALSKIPKLLVIARQSSFTYKGKSISIPTVGRELGVQYVLEGSVRKAGDTVRITAQLIDAKTNHHLWAERYERELKDIFAIQDEITMKIITAMQVKLTEGEQARVVGKGTDNIEAYAKLIEARGHIIRLNKHDNIVGRQKAEEAIALDSDYAVAYAILSMTHWLDVMLGSSKSPRQSMGQAMELAQKAIALDDSVAQAHSSLGLIYTLRGQYEKGISECERAIALEPNNESAYRLLGLALRYADRREEAIPVYQRAIRLSPFPKSTTLFGLGLAYIFTGRYEEGVAACKKAVDIQPNNILSQVNLTFAYTVSGREEEARATAAQVLRLDPDFSVARFAKKTLKYKNKSDTERFVVALHKAGLPE
jgi:adenylate cyclase